MTLFAPLLAQQQPPETNSALIAFGIYTVAVFGLAIASNRLLQSKSFLSEYFLGSRGLGVWAFALTFAATSSSGGSFMGFPSKIYTHGWSLALWIGSYMLVPMVSMGLLAKRLNQMGRRAGAITIPDVLRARFESRTFGVMATMLIIFFMSFNMVAQFKGGSEILRTLLDDVPMFQQAREALGRETAGMPVLGGVEPGYLLCLSCFAVAVILYTSYGGFRAVVWTDVLQGIVMVAGVLLMLPIALYLVNGLSSATDAMEQMTPPRYVTARLELAEPATERVSIHFGTWIVGTSGESNGRIYRSANKTDAVIDAGATAASYLDSADPSQEFPLLEITTAGDEERIRQKHPLLPMTVEVVETKKYKFGDDKPGVYLTAKGPSRTDVNGFLPLSLAVSFFFMWTFSGAGQPSNMVRLMAFRSSQTLRRAIFTVAVYYSAIYFPLVLIFCCARVLLPGMEIESDRIMPEMAEHLTTAVGVPWLAGLLVAAPFAAVMSTVDSFLLMISSACVRDVYQREINPDCSEKTIKRLTYTVTAVVGVAAVLGALYPPAYLQDIIVYTGSGLSGSFLMPVVFALYWPRLNSQGAIGGMAAGYLTHLSLYGYGWVEFGRFEPYRIMDFDPLLPAFLVSGIMCVLVTLCTPPPPQHIVKKFFHA